MQLENATLYRISKDLDIKDAYTGEKSKITLHEQPNKSCNLNVSDVGFFNSIRYVWSTTNTSTFDELIDALTEKFPRSESIALDNVLITLQPCMEQDIGIVKRKRLQNFLSL